ncbi:RNA polymerase II-associated protein 1 isoform X2 [Phymastichus coffea]|nr:RNA polymerase II-associated protein 1 isoform X2 [Phymastichus coffea]
MQEEFLENKLSPCTKVVNLRAKKKRDEELSTKKQSIFAQRRAEVAENRIFTSQRCGSVTNEDKIEELEKPNKKTDPIYNCSKLPPEVLLGEIFERKPTKHEFKPKIQVNSETGFPNVFKCPHLFQDGDSKESLFMCVISKEKSSIVKSSANAKIVELSSTSTKEICKMEFDKNSELVSNGKISFGSIPSTQELHEENVQRLNQMTEEEKLAAIKEIKSTCDSKTIAFLKSMKKLKNKSKKQILNKCNSMEMNKSTTLGNSQMDVDKISLSTESKNDEVKMETNAGDVDEDLPEPVVEIVKKAEEKGWVHMDDLEPEKVKWMENLPIEKGNQQPPEEPYNARFDFDGTLLPFNDENLTVDKGLHHHGEEPERPGYALQELLQLTRSATQSQRCTALTILANIIEKTHLGSYDRALQPSLMNTLNESNILLLLRFSLDDTALPVVTSALQALRALLFSETDEICLDKIFGIEDFVEPILKPSMKDVKNTESLKDNELAQMDTVAAALRSDILLRIRFILSEMNLQAAAMTAALEILTRLARHSRETALNIACLPNLLDIVVKKCIPLSMNRPVQNYDSSKIYGCPLVAAVRLCRILIIYAGRPIVERLKHFEIIHSLLTYISSDASRQEIRLQIESLRLWRLFLHFGIETNSISGTRHTLISQLRLLESALDLDMASPLKCDYATALIAIAKYDEPLKVHVAVLLAKWSTQLSRISTPTWNHTVLITEVLRTLHNVNSFQTDWLKNSNIFTQLSSSSNLLSDVEPAVDREPESLPSLGVMTYEGKLQPIMSQNSHIIFLKTALEQFLEHSRVNAVEEFFENANVQNYLRRLSISEWSLERSWFSRIEYSFLIIIIKAENKLKTYLKEKLCDTIWKIAIKLISALPADCPTKVRDIFVLSLAPERVNIRFLESGIASLDLNKKYNDVEDVDIAVKYFDKFVSRNGCWSEAALPKDWLYLPLIDAYSRIKYEKAWQESDTISILYMLKLELIIPELTQNLSPSVRFSRMLLIYLCDTKFLHSPECDLPQRIITQLVQSNYKQLDLTTEVPGLTSFTDLFTALCENFLANSYGTDCFAQALLVFGAQRYEIHYRKLLWSEHAGVLPYLRLLPEKLLLPYREYLYPLEQDASLIESYITALVRNTVKEFQSPVMYGIALHHSAIFLKNNEKLAMSMRSSIEKLMRQESTRIIAEKLLNYEPNVKLE